jgi:hypothetical protein
MMSCTEPPDQKNLAGAESAATVLASGIDRASQPISVTTHVSEHGAQAKSSHRTGRFRDPVAPWSPRPG